MTSPRAAPPPVTSQPPVAAPVVAAPVSAPSSPVVAPPPSVESEQHADATGEERKSGLEMMLSRINLDAGAVIRKGTHGRE